MMETALHPRSDVVGYYWNAYFEWRALYALSDACMPELIATIRAETDAGMVSGEEITRLQKLANMIESELAAGQVKYRAASAGIQPYQNSHQAPIST